MKKQYLKRLREACTRLNALIDKKNERSALRDKAVLKQSREIDKLIVRSELQKDKTDD